MTQPSIARPTLCLLVALAFIFVNDARAAARYTIGGNVSGLAADKSVTLLNNGGNALTRTVNGSFVFSTRVASGEIYAVTVGTQPSGQKCSVAKGAATVTNANVTNVAVTCANKYSIGGSITGLGADKSVTLLNNGVNALTRTVNGSFVFSTLFASGGRYTVTVGTQPSGQKCSVANGSFLLGNAKVTNVAVTCVNNKFSIGGTIAGLAPGKSVTLLNNGVDALTRTVNGSFVFSTLFASGGRYTVTVGTQPSGQKCSVANGSVLLGSANITNVKVSCSAAPTYLLTDLGTLGGTGSYGGAINDSGQVTGYANTSGDAAIHAFVTINGVMRDLGTLGGTHSEGTAINASGQVTGYANTSGNAAVHAFVMHNSVMIDLGTLGGGTDSLATAINDSGQVTGYATTSGDAVNHAFVTHNGVMTDLGTLGGAVSYGWAINASGQVAGEAETTAGAAVPRHAFVTHNGVMTDLGTLGGTNSWASAINASGQVTGQAATTGSTMWGAIYHAFVTNNGVMTDLGTLGGTGSYGGAINDSGQVTGYANTSGDAAIHAFVTINGVMRDLGTLGGTHSEGTAINASGQVTGYSETTDGSQHAFLFSDGQMQDLNDLVDRTPPGGHFITLEIGVAITDTGFILANGFDALVGQRVYLLSPVCP